MKNDQQLRGYPAHPSSALSDKNSTSSVAREERFRTLKTSVVLASVVLSLVRQVQVGTPTRCAESRDSACEQRSVAQRAECELAIFVCSRGLLTTIVN